MYSVILVVIIIYVIELSEMGVENISAINLQLNTFDKDLEIMTWNSFFLVKHPLLRSDFLFR